MRAGDEEGAEAAWDQAYRTLLVENHLPTMARTPELIDWGRRRMRHLQATDPAGCWVAEEKDHIVGIAELTFVEKCGSWPRSASSLGFRIRASATNSSIGRWPMETRHRLGQFSRRPTLGRFTVTSQRDSSCIPRPLPLAQSASPSTHRLGSERVPSRTPTTSTTSTEPCGEQIEERTSSFSSVWVVSFSSMKRADTPSSGKETLPCCPRSMRTPPLGCSWLGSPSAHRSHLLVWVGSPVINSGQSERWPRLVYPSTSMRRS